MILDEIVVRRMMQLEQEKAQVPMQQMVLRAQNMQQPTKDFQAALCASGLSVIAEIKKASPSKGVICPDFQPLKTAKAYQAYGAAAISVLTERHYFQGSNEVLTAVRQAVDLPILRKDFIVDAYQIYEARAIGADAVLLIASLLDGPTLAAYRHLAEELGLAALVEIHNEYELERALYAECPIIGINNRDLKTFHVDLAVTDRLASQVPRGCLVVSESGIQSPEDMQRASGYGADAALIGETLMRSQDIAETLRSLRKGA